MIVEEAKEIIIRERDSLKANPRVKVEDCLYEAFDLAIKALEQEPCEDAISRQAVIDTLTKTSGIRGDALKALYDLPSVTPQPNTDVLDKIRAEIEGLTYYWCEVNPKSVIDDALQIIDKYKAERSGE